MRADSSHAHELEVAKRLARAAGEIILQVYSGRFEVVEKPKGAGPVTEADSKASAYLVDALHREFPGYGVVSEEDPDTSDSKRFDRCWYVDPLDGTREFVNRNGEFAVHIGLAIEGEARLGVVYRPVGEKLYAGVVGEGCVLEHEGKTRPLRILPADTAAGLRLLVSRSHRPRRPGPVEESMKVREVISSGSVGLKCGLLAEGVGDLYIHSSGKSQRWDACAPEAVVRSAGGVLCDLKGDAYKYDGSELQNARGLMACSVELFPEVIPYIRTHAKKRGLI